MGEILNPREILEIAVSVEENGEQLYLGLEKKARKEEVKQMWCFLKEQEKVHRIVFMDLIEETDEIAAEFGSGDYHAYLKVIAADYIITRDLMEKKRDAVFNSDLEAVEFAISMEKESILTYSALCRALKPQKQALVDKIIAEEQLHLVRLHAMRSALKKGA